MSSPPDTTPTPSTFIQAAGLVLDKVETSHVTGWIDLHSEHHQPWGLVHGGVYTTAIESAASVGASTAAQEHGLVAVGVNNNTNFLRSMTEGRVAVDARAIQQGKTQQLWECASPTTTPVSSPPVRFASRTSRRGP